MKKPCVICGIPTKGSRCKQHHIKNEYNSSDYKRNRTIVLNAWIRDHGYTCPGLPSLDHAAHPCTNTNPLTCDHNISVSEWRRLGLPGSPNQIENLRPLCRAINSARGNGMKGQQQMG